jgi:hypothetical protein
VARAKGSIGHQRRQMRAYLDTARQSLPSLMKTFAVNADPTFQWPTTGTVFQYSRMDTLRGLLGGAIFDTPQKTRPLEALWATSSLHMNDSEEFVRGRDVVRSEIDTLPPGKIKTQMKLALKDSDALEVYCACFSAVDDDLSQWRGYGDNGSGICLAFDLQELLQDLDGVGYWVVYGKTGDDDDQRAVASGLVSYLHGAISAALPPGPVPPAVYREIREQLTEIWPTICLGFKHSDFASEKEFRIVYSEAVGRTISPSFRPFPVVPFVKLRMRSGGQIPLRQVRLGPAISSKWNVRSVQLALTRSSLGSVKAHPSDIPYVPK